MTKIQLKPTKSIIWKDFLGVNAHFLHFVLYQMPERIPLFIQSLKQLGLNKVRLDLHWDTVEAWGHTGEFEGNLKPLDQLVELFNQNDIDCLLYFLGTARFQSPHPLSQRYAIYPPKDFTVFADRLVKLVKRYPSINTFEVWNEQNLLGFWITPNPDNYGRLLKTCLEAVKAAAPNKRVIAGSVSQYGEYGFIIPQDMTGELIKQGFKCTLPYHPYSQFPEGEKPGGQIDVDAFSPYVDGQEFIRLSIDMNKKLTGAETLELWTTEWGWSTYSSDNKKELQDFITEEQQADYILRRLVLTAALDIDRTYLFTLMDLDGMAGNRDAKYGILRVDNTPKPAYTALQNFIALTGDGMKPIALPTINNAPEMLYSYAWQGTNGNNILFFWNQVAVSLTLPTIKKAQLHNLVTGEKISLDNAQGISVTTKNTLQALVY